MLFFVLLSLFLFYFFFFKQKTAYEMRISDWSSDVCSSDLNMVALAKAVPDFHACDARHRHSLRHIDALELGARRATDDSADAEIGRASCRDRVCQYV